VSLPRPDVDRPDLVICVHGFLRTGMSMAPMAVGLRRRGFLTRLVSQWNVQARIPELADGLYHRTLRIRDLATRRRGYEPTVHFVTHSMGGIVVRSMLSRHAVPGANRVVMLAPPNRGSRMAEHMHDRVLRFPWGSFDPLRKLLPGERGECEGAGDPDHRIGIIAGAPPKAFGFPWSFRGLGRQDGPLAFTPGQPGEHDGKVALDETRLPEVDDFLVVPRGHTFMMASPLVIEQAAAFLHTGSFHRPAD
jgi:triacylglycerol lipase